jgi:hypothetical protein
MRYWFQIALTVVAVAYCWRRGGQPERAAAAVIPAMYLLDLLYHVIWGQVTTYDRVNVGHLVLDTAALFVFVLIAVRANRWWTIWLASAQIVAVVSHFLRGITSAMHPWVYAAMTRGPSWLEIMLLFVGTALYQYRRRARSAPLQSSSARS